MKKDCLPWGLITIQNSKTCTINEKGYKKSSEKTHFKMCRHTLYKETKYSTIPNKMQEFHEQVNNIKQFKTKYSKTCLKRPLKNRQNKDLNDKWELNEGR